MRASAMLLILIVLVDASTSSSQGWRELMKRKRWEALKTLVAQTKKDIMKDMAKTKKDMIKRDQQMQQNFSSALNEVDEKIDKMKEGFVSFGLLFANLLKTIQQEDTDGNLNIDALTQSEDALETSEEGSEDDYNYHDQEDNDYSISQGRSHVFLRGPVDPTRSLRWFESCRGVEDGTRCTKRCRDWSCTDTARCWQGKCKRGGYHPCDTTGEHSCCCGTCYKPKDHPENAACFAAFLN